MGVVPRMYSWLDSQNERVKADGEPEEETSIDGRSNKPAEPRECGFAGGGGSSRAG